MVLSSTAASSFDHSEIKAFFDANHATHEAWLKELHDNPEPAFGEVKTNAIVRRLLKESCPSFQVSDPTLFPTAPTAILAVYVPQNVPQDKLLKPILLRGDMDAVPMAGSTEDTMCTSCIMPGSPPLRKKPIPSPAEAESGSQRHHHGCGHDAHTTLMLVTAHWIEHNKHIVNRKVVIFFQPAEESRRESDHRSGAEVVVDEGLFDVHPDVHAVYAMHCLPGMETGNFITSTSAILAGSGGFTITIEGTGGHAADPGRHMTEPLLAASAIVTCGQTIISRRFEPSRVAILAFCVIDGLGSTAGNVCPGTVEVKGRIHAFSDEDWYYLTDELERISTHIGKAYNCDAKCELDKGYPVTENTPHAGEISYNAAATVLKDEEDLNVYRAGYGVGEFPPSTAGEDFSYLLLKRPGAFAGIAIGSGFALHTPEFMAPAKALNFGGRYFAEIVLSPDCTDPLPSRKLRTSVSSQRDLGH